MLLPELGRVQAVTCEDFQLRLTAFSLGELEPGERQQARDHLAACDDCASRVLVDRQLTALLRTSAVPAPEATRTACWRRCAPRPTGRSPLAPIPRGRSPDWRPPGRRFPAEGPKPAGGFP